MCSVVKENQSKMIQFTFALLLISFSSCLAGSYMNTKGEWIPTCQMKDPNFKTCMKQGLHVVLKKWATGIEGFTAINSIDPLKIRQINVKQKEGSTVYDATLTEVSISGISNAEIVDLELNTHDHTWKTHALLPAIRFEGNCRVLGSIIGIQLNAEGGCWFSANNLDVTIKLGYSLYEKDSHVFMNVTSPQIRYTLKDFKLNLNNLEGGNTVNELLARNADLIADISKPVVYKTAGAIIVSIVNKLVTFIPFDYFISDIRV